MTAQRIGKVVAMRHSDIDADGVWTVRVVDEDREKGTIGAVRLPPLALAAIQDQRRDGSDFVFPGRLARKAAEQRWLDQGEA